MDAEILEVLQSIDNTLKQILSARGKAKPAVPDTMLDGKYGDPDVRQKDPRDWGGDSMKGRKFSECPPEYLDLLAERYDYFAGKEQDATKAGYNRKDAQLARAWAARLRSGWTSPAPPPRVSESDTEPQW